MQAGRRDRKVSIQRQGEPVDDGYTTKPGAWAELATRKAQIIWPKGSEPFQQEGIVSQKPATFILPSDSLTRTLTTLDRIVYGGQAYDLKSVNDIGRNEGVECVGVSDPARPADV